MESGNKTERVGRIEVRRRAVLHPRAAFVESDLGPFLAFDQETVHHLLVIADQSGFIIIKIIIAGGFPHLRADSQ